MPPCKVYHYYHPPWSLPPGVHRRQDEGWHCLYLNNKQNFIKSIDITQTFRFSTDQILLPRNCIKLPPKICRTRCFPSPTSFRQIPNVSNVKDTKELEHPRRFVRKRFDPFSFSHRFRHLKIRKNKLAGFISVSWLRNGPHLNCRKSIFMLLPAFPGSWGVSTWFSGWYLGTLQ